MSKFVLLALVNLLLCINFGSAFSIIPFLKNGKSTQFAVIDRLNPSETSRGYVMPQVDRTTFTVSRNIWLKQMDIPQLYIYKENVKVELGRTLPVNVKVIEKRTNFDLGTILYSEKVEINPKSETAVDFGTELLLKATHTYEIHIEDPFYLAVMPLMYDENLETKKFTLKRSFFTSIVIEFPQINKTVKNTSRSPSTGAVKRLHLKY